MAYNETIYENDETVVVDAELIDEFPVKDRTRGERRKRDFSKAKRKEEITREVYHMDPLFEEGWHYYDALHQYSKNKIHCSCPSCSMLEKTNLKRVKGKGYGKRGERTREMWARPPVIEYDENGNVVVCIPGIPKGGYCPTMGVTNERRGKNWSMADIKRIQEMNESMKEYFTEKVE